MNARRRTWIRATLWIGLAGMALLWWYDATRGIRLRVAADGVAAPAVAWVRPDGAIGALADLRGRVVVLNLWASWCPPCRAEIPMLARLERELGAEGLSVVGLNVEDLSSERLAALAAGLGAEYEVGFPASPLDGPLAGADLLPQTWLVDRAGRVRASHAGAVTYRSIERAARELLAEPP